MSKKEIIIYPDVKKELSIMGEQIKLARLRRELPASLIAERANISRTTLWQIEKGSPYVSMGAYVNVLAALGGLDKDILYLARDDETGRLHQDFNLITKKRIR